MSTSSASPRSIPLLVTIGRWLFLCGLLVMVTGDGPATFVRVSSWATPVPFLGWPWLHLVLLVSAFVSLAAGGGVSPWTSERLRFLQWPVAALMSAFLVSSVFSAVPSLSALAFGLVVAIVGFCFLSTILLEDDVLRERVWIVVSTAILLLAVRVVIWRLDEGLDVAAFQLLNNAWLGKLQLAWVFNLFAPLLLMRFIVEERRGRARLHGVAWASAGIATYVLFSRMGSLVFVLTTVGVCLLNPSYWRRWIVIMGGGAVLAGILFLRSMEMTSFIVSTLVELDRNPGVQMRLEVWQDALQMFRADPVLGIGLGTYDEVAYTVPGTRAVADFRLDGWHAHNVFLHVLVEAGIFGLLAWCYLWYALVGHLWRCWRKADAAGRLATSGALAAVGAFLVMSLTEVLVAARAHESLRMNLAVGLVVVLALHSTSTRTDRGLDSKSPATLGSAATDPS